MVPLRDPRIEIGEKHPHVAIEIESEQSDAAEDSGPNVGSVPSYVRSIPALRNKATQTECICGHHAASMIRYSARRGSRGGRRGNRGRGMQRPNVQFESSEDFWGTRQWIPRPERNVESIHFC